MGTTCLESVDPTSSAFTHDHGCAANPRETTSGSTTAAKSVRVTSPDELEVTFGENGGGPHKIPALALGSLSNSDTSFNLAALEGPRCQSVLPRRTITVSARCAGNDGDSMNRFSTTTTPEPRQGV